MNALTIVLIVLLVMVSLCGFSHFVISYKRAKAGKKSLLWEEVEEEKED